MTKLNTENTTKIRKVGSGIGVKRTIMVLDSETIGFGIYEGDDLLAIKYNEDSKKIETKPYGNGQQFSFVKATKEDKEFLASELLSQLGIEIEFYGFGGHFKIVKEEDIDRISEIEKFFKDNGKWRVSKKDKLCIWKKENTMTKLGYSTKYEKLCYDIGYTVTRYNSKTRKMDVLRERSYLVKEVFLNMKVMEKAYFFAKHPQYLEMLGNGEIQIKPFQEILEIMEQDINEFEINTFSNYNAGFDTNALKDTIKLLKCNQPSNFKVMLEDVWCIWNMACQVLYNRPSYVKTALENGWITDSGKYLKTNAEVGYSYMTKDYEFIEDHTALSDARIETELLGYILRQGKKIDKGINSACWRSANVKNYCNVTELAIGRLTKDEIKGILKDNK